MASIISHRGLWTKHSEKNSEEALQRCVGLGFGVETDLRDADGEVVVSHDPAELGALSFDALLDSFSAFGEVTMALNIKADGLADLLADVIRSRCSPSTFVFDMSVPETLKYLDMDIPVFTRHSEFEHEPVLYEHAAGIWLDCFKSDWYGEREVTRHLEAEKRVCMVSPELHDRDRDSRWERWSNWDCIASPDLLVCTDFPIEASGALGSS